MFANSIILPTVVFAAIGFLALLAYVQVSGGFSLEQISAKRSVISGLEVGDDYQSHGVLRFLNSFGQVALWGYLGKTVYDNPRFSYISVRGIFIAFLFVNAAALPFYSSSRSEVAFILIVAVAIDAGVRHHGPSRFAILFGALVTVGALVFMTNVRGTKDWLQNAQLDLIEGLEGLVVLNRNFGDFFTFTHVTRAVPGLLDWAMGSTIYGHLLAPIPRAIWPDKPLVSIGPQIGINVYGNERSGVPPGWYAEWYWNFGLLGFVLGAVLFGVALKILANMVRSDLWANPLFVVFYCVVLFRFGYFAIGGGIGSSVFKMVTEAVCLGCFFLVCTIVPDGEKGLKVSARPIRAVGALGRIPVWHQSGSKGNFGRLRQRGV
ncbi:hypothetical protein [Dietzia natronolimnaea]|uniref:hypothetical protein n=1 Tax=Dietzia natronolimnaea TaxID=161920 RepID=UPI001140B5DF|nr:hypothetical protein [Dietzia natronolimnaea]